MEEKSINSILINKYSNMVFKIAKSYLRNVDDAEDIVQDVFIKYVSNNKPFGDDLHEKRWIIKVTKNLCRNLKNSANRRYCYNSYKGVEDSSYTIDESLMFDAMNSLGEKYRIVCDLYYFQDFKTKEISEILNISEDTTRKRLERARSMIKNYYRKVDDVYGQS